MTGVLSGAELVDGYIFHSEALPHRDRTVCSIIDRAEMPIGGMGVEPCFVVRFSDGEIRTVLSQQLTPWYPV